MAWAAAGNDLFRPQSSRSGRLARPNRRAVQRFVFSLISRCGWDRRNQWCGLIRITNSRLTPINLASAKVIFVEIHGEFAFAFPAKCVHRTQEIARPI